MAVNPIYTNGATTPPATVEQFTNMALKYARTEISGAAASSHYSDFDKSEVEYGAILESVRVPASESTAVNHTGTSLPAPAWSANKVRYYSDWTPRQYMKSIADDSVEKVVGNPDDEARLIAAIINANAEGERIEADDNYKNFFLSFGGGSTRPSGAHLSLLAEWDGSAPTGDAGIAGYLPDLNQYEFLKGFTRETVFEGVYTELARVSKDMTFNNSLYSGGFKCGAKMEDLRIILPTAFTSAASVQFLSRLYNLSEVGKLPKIIECDGLYIGGFNYIPDEGGQAVSGDYMAAFIVDTRAIGRVTRGRRSEAWRPDGKWRTDYYSKVDDMYYFNPNYKAYAIGWIMPK